MFLPAATGMPPGWFPLRAQKGRSRQNPFHTRTAAMPACHCFVLPRAQQILRYRPATSASKFVNRHLKPSCTFLIEITVLDFSFLPSPWGEGSGNGGIMDPAVKTSASHLYGEALSMPAIPGVKNTAAGSAAMVQDGYEKQLSGLISVKNEEGVPVEETSMIS